MALVRWDPARELDALQGDVNRLFDSFFGRREGAPASGRRWVPAMDLAETEEDLVLRADLPGMGRDEIEIEVRDNVLTVSGERRAEHEEKQEGYHRVERSFGRFSRSIELPEGIAAEDVRATFDRGVLEVTIPKPAQRKPTRVEIEAGEPEAAAAAAGSDGERG